MAKLLYRRAPSRKREAHHFSPATKLHRQICQVALAASDIDVPGDHLGLEVVAEYSGRACFDMAVVVPDDCATSVRTKIEKVARDQGARVITWTERWANFSNWQGRGSEHEPLAFRRCYTGSRTFVTWDLGRYFGLIAEDKAIGKGRRRGTWKIAPPGWGYRSERSGLRARTWQQPLLRLSRFGQAYWGVAFEAPRSHEYGRWVERDGKLVHYRGRFVSVGQLGRAYSEHRKPTFTELCEEHGIEPVELPIATRVDAESARRLMDAVECLWKLAYAISSKGPAWSDDLTTYSGGSLAQRFLANAGISPEGWTLGKEADDKAWLAQYGGRIEYDKSYHGQLVSAVHVDIGGAHPLGFHHTGSWDLVTATEWKDASADLESWWAGREQVRDKLSYDLRALEKFGCAVCEVEPVGERWPVRVPDTERPDGRLKWAPHASSEPVFYSAYDVLLAAIDSGHLPKITRTWRPIPTGHQKVRLQQSPFPELRASKKMPKPMVNSLAYGLWARADDPMTKTDNGWQHEEVGAVYSNPWIACTVAATTRYLIELARREVEAVGGHVARIATDSLVVVGLSRKQVIEALKSFESLSEGAWPIWGDDYTKISEPIKTAVYGPNKMLKLSDGKVIGFSDSGGIAGIYGLPYEKDSALRDAFTAMVEGERWEYADYPAITHFQVTSEAILTSLPEKLGAAIGSYFRRARALSRTVYSLDRPGSIWYDEGQETTLDEDWYGETLGHKLDKWGGVPSGQENEVVEIENAEDIGYVGQTRRLIKANEAGEPVRMPRLCGCGCGELLEEGRKNKRFVSAAHKQRHYRKT